MNMSSLNTSIANIFKSILAKSTSKVNLEDANNRLLETLKASPHEDEYMNRLLEEIAFHAESAKALHGILQQLIQLKKFPHLQGVEQVMEKAKDKIRSDSERLTSLYREELKVEDLGQDKLTKLEVYYITSMVELQLTFAFMNAFGNKSYNEKFTSLFTFTPEEVGETVYNYVNTYSSLLFEKQLSEIK
jgi:hypothetical protein